MGARIVIVSKTVVDGTVIARDLYRRYGFAHLRMAQPIQRLNKLLYGRSTDLRWPPVTYYQYYDAIYSLDHDNFLRNIDTRLPHIKRSHIVIADCRYVNEVVGLVDRGFQVVRVVSEYSRKPRMTEGMEQGSVTLYEHFAESMAKKPYTPTYQMIRYRDPKRTRLSVDQLVDNLNLPER